MKSILLGFTLALVVCYAEAQKAPAKFGDVSLSDLQMKKYEKDTSAAAVILVDFGESSLPFNQEKGFLLSFERLVRIKILKPEGLDWANFQIPLYHEGSNDEKLSALKAYTYNLVGGKVVETKMKSENVFKEKSDKNWDIMKIYSTRCESGIRNRGNL